MTMTGKTTLLISSLCASPLCFVYLVAPEQFVIPLVPSLSLMLSAPERRVIDWYRVENFCELKEVDVFQLFGEKGKSINFLIVSDRIERN